MGAKRIRPHTPRKAHGLPGRQKEDLVQRRGSLTVVVPLYQEEAAVPGLSTGLREFLRTESVQRDVDFVLVDDGSTDRTLALLHQHFADLPARIVAHERNRGLTEALLTGSRAARGSMVGWLDSDLTYEPDVLRRLALLIDAGADIALSSCYHPEGGVEGVARWRLMLSRFASRFYRRTTGCPVHTFTSMVRVYRREVLERCVPIEGGFHGIAEVLLQAIVSRYQIAEAPAVLHRRLVGESKMKVLRTGIGHLRLMWRYGRLARYMTAGMRRAAV